MRSVLEVLGICELETDIWSFGLFDIQAHFWQTLKQYERFSRLIKRHKVDRDRIRMDLLIDVMH